MRELLFALFHEYFLTWGRRSHSDPPPLQSRMRLLAILGGLVFLPTWLLSLLVDDPTLSRSLFVISRCALVAVLLGVFGKWLSNRAD